MQGLLLFNEVEHNTFGRNLVRSAKGIRLRPAGIVCLFLWLVAPVNLNVAVVLDATGDSRRDGLDALDLAIAVSWREARGLYQYIVDVGWASPGLQDRGHSKWGVETVDVPIVGARAAGDDGPDLGCGLLAVVAEHRLALLALLEEIRCLLIALPFPGEEC